MILEELESDPLLFIGDGGMVGYTEPTVPAGALGDDAAAPAAAGAPPGDVFALHSRPGSTRVVYLDFDGHTTVDDYWNGAYGVDEIASAPYSIDSSPAFSDTERQRIFDIWEIVADDYAPFDVDVTTQEPAAGGLVKSSAGDTAYGKRIVISPTDWYHESQGVLIGGIALVDVFSANFDHSAFVFSDNLGGGAVKYVAEAASHEAGHTFGLYHDGTSSVGYYAGHGDWAPIMGVGYYKQITQWSKGEYTAANNQEDDLALVLQHAPVAPDDHGNAAGTATALTAPVTATGSLAVSDVDVFSVTAGAGTLTATLAPTGDNLHATVTIKDSGGQTVATAAPAVAVGWSAVASATVASGTYTMTVERSGWMTAATGFTSYASLGGYSLSVGAEPPATTTTTTTTTTAPSSSTTAPSSTTSTSTAPSSTSTSSTSTSSTSTSSTSTTTSTTTTVPPPTPVDRRAGFTAMTPKRIVDTRTALGGSRRLAAGRAVTVQVTGRHAIPSTATAAVVNVTAVGPAAAGRLSVVPCTTGTPTITTVQYATGQVVANTTIATLDGRGRFCVWTSAASDVLVDITGWLAPATGARLTPVGPTRLADTRSGLGGSRRLAGNRTMVLDVSSKATGASAVALNVSVVGPAAPGYVTVYPCGASRPATSTINHVGGEVRANNTIVGVGGGKVCIYSLVAADVVVDLVGTFGSTGLRYLPTTPRRLVDTRTSGGRLTAGTSREYGVGTASSGSARAASVTVTASDHRSDGYTTAYACGALPTASTVNHLARQSVSNGTIARTTGRSTSCAFSSAGGHLQIDLTGWWV